MTSSSQAVAPSKAPLSISSPASRADLSVSTIQAVTEEIVLKLARHARELTGKKHLCLAGGVSLNCVANGRILRRWR